MPVTILRPSIIESPRRTVSRWIRGFAWPSLSSSPTDRLIKSSRVPEGIVDVIPVDLVVAAICAVAARGAAPSERPDVVQVASGAVNPLHYGRLVDLVQSWFTEHPIYDDRGQAIAVAEWGFPGRGRVQKQLNRAKSGISRAERLLSLLPVRGQQAEFGATLEEKRELVDRALGYVELYGAYAECEAVYGLDRLLALWESLDAEDREVYSFDPRTIEWDSYVHDVHLPSIVLQARVKTTPGARQAQPRGDRLRAQVLSPDRHIAAFDLENTLIASNVVASYSWLATRRLSRDDRARFVLSRCSKGRRCSSSIAAIAATSCAFSTVATTAHRSIRSTRTRPRCSAISSSPSRSLPRSAACASIAGSVTAHCSSPAPSISS